MYEHIYFDLDDTLVKDNPVTGKSELLASGLEKYNELVKESPNAIKILLTNRNSDDIKFPEVYSFDEIVGRNNMEEYIDIHIHDVSISNLLSFKNSYLFLRGKSLYKRKQTPKLLYIFLRSVIKNEEIYVLDDDRRVSGMFSK
jgi:hypothetical protein